VQTDPPEHPVTKAYFRLESADLQTVDEIAGDLVLVMVTASPCPDILAKSLWCLILIYHDFLSAPENHYFQSRGWVACQILYCYLQ